MSSKRKGRQKLIYRPLRYASKWKLRKQMLGKHSSFVVNKSVFIMLYSIFATATGLEPVTFPLAIQRAGMFFH